MTVDDSALQHMHQQLSRIGPLPEAEWQHLAQQLRSESFDSGAQLVRAGEPARAIWFLLRGIVRFFYLSRDGRESNKAFARPGEFIGPLAAISTGQACDFTIEAMQRVEAVAIPVPMLPQLYARHPCWERIGRVLAERALVRKEVREREFLQLDPMQRYRCFLQRYPGIEAQIAQKQIASYIGISEVSLSRLLRRAREAGGSADARRPVS